MEQEQAVRSLGQARANYPVPLLATHIANGCLRAARWHVAGTVPLAKAQHSHAQARNHHEEAEEDGTERRSRTATPVGVRNVRNPDQRRWTWRMPGTTERVERPIATTAMIQIHVHAPSVAREPPVAGIDDRPCSLRNTQRD